MKRYLIAGLWIVLVASCAEYTHQDYLKAHRQIIDKGIADWRNTHDTNCLTKLMPIVDSCVEFQDYCNRHDTLYVESYVYTELKINILNSLKRYDEALSLISQFPDEFRTPSPFGKNYLLKTTLIRRYNFLNNYTERDSIINELIEDMNFQFRANYGNTMPSDTIYDGCNLDLADTTNLYALMDYFLICIIRGDDKKIMINKVKQTYSLDKENNKIDREFLIRWINNTGVQDFYDM